MIKKMNSLPTGSIADSTLGLLGSPVSGTLSVATYLALRSYFNIPTGSNGDIQFNNSGAFGANPNLSWANNNNLLVGTSVDDGISKVQINNTTNPQLALYDGGSSAFFQIDAQGNLVIATSPGALFVNTSLYVNQVAFFQTYIAWGLPTAFASLINGTTDGTITMYNSSLGDFNMLQFGGSTSTFPALKRSGSQLYAKLADDSGNADFSARKLFVQASPTSSGVNNCFENDGTNLYFTIGGVKKVVSLT